MEHSTDISVGPVSAISDTLYNTPVQKTAADITKKALVLLPRRLEDTGAQIIGTVHNEIKPDYVFPLLPMLFQPPDLYCCFLKC